MRKPYLSPAYCSANNVLIQKSTTHSIEITVTEATTPETKALLQSYFFEYTLSFVAVLEAEFAQKLSRYFSTEEETTGGKETQSAEKNAENEQNVAIDKIEDDSPVINLLNSIILEGLNRRASDIHIESDSCGSRVRYRVDGALITSMHLNAEKTAALSVRLKMLASLNVLEKRRAQDGRINVESQHTPLDIRLSIVPSVYGESIVMRLLSVSQAPESFTELGFIAKHQTILHSLLSVPYGLILLTGPTGSGKTTTLSAFLKELCSDTVKIISLEDPVEYRIDGITQIQTDEETGMSFNELLRRLFRQDPDIIMIGEIRDNVTAELAVRTALTGHLVFATLHTNSACSAPVRLQDMGVPPYLTASVLRAVIAQRLVQKNGGGRTVIAEILVATPELETLLAEGCTHQKLEFFMQKNGMDCIHTDALAKIRDGITTMSAVEKELGLFQNKEKNNAE